jgi:hypothetical protein
MTYGSQIKFVDDVSNAADPLQQRGLVDRSLTTKAFGGHEGHEGSKFLILHELRACRGSDFVVKRGAAMHRAAR